jgi:hypothetical protein
VYTTTFYKDEDFQNVLARWMDFLRGKLTKTWPTLLDFEEDLAKKVGPLSVMLPLSERMGDIESYYKCVEGTFDEFDPRAINATLDEFEGVSGLLPRSQELTVRTMKKSTSSGAPLYPAKRRAVVQETVPCKYQDGQISLSPVHSDGKPWKPVAMLGWRGQEGGPNPEDVKQRVVWMFPFAVNILELQVYQPLIEACQRLDLVPAWVSMDSVDDRITALFDTKDPNDLVICTDFSKFDQHFNATMQKAAYQILDGLLTPSAASKTWLQDVFPIKYNIPIMYDVGQCIFGSHGMGSGSGGTNADETLAHRALQHEAAILNGQTLNPNSMCLGDDGILTYPGINIEDVTRTYTRHGLDMNVDKQYASADDCTYLRRWHHKDYRLDGVCVGVYSTARALGRLFMQERFYSPKEWGPKMVALRQLSILENVKFHPLREEFVDFCMKGDKYRLGLDLPGFLTDIERIAAEATDHMPDFLGYTKTMQKADAGIAGWWIVQYLKSKL